MFDRRVTVITGHFGSGKTEIAVNGALDLAAKGADVAIVDLDVVKPYFRTRSAREWLARAGVRLVAPEGENIHADLPIVVPEVRAILGDPSARVVVDAGGDDTGARVLGSLADVLPRGPDTEHLLVLNFRRPFTEGPDQAVAAAREIQAAARLPFTGIVSNTHLMGETTPEVVEAGYSMAEETGRALGLPVVAVVVAEETRPLVRDEAFRCRVVTIRRVLRPAFDATSRQRKTGPLFVLN